ncbi:MAG TPA: glycosyltransferase family 4 protein [Tepidisphaeraceae bacterium]|nr:glycosyltransferase family 4 protein [Tepidisphaeraceae bacterium]
MPEYELFTLFTHAVGSAPWAMEMPPEINPHQFGPGESSEDQGRLRHALREWRKAGRIMRWLQGRDVAAVLLVGYNDAGRLRLVRWLHGCRIPVLLFGDSNIRGDFAKGLHLVVKRLWLGYFMRRCAAVLPCGRLGRDYFLKYGAKPDRTFFFPYEPDYALIKAVDEADVAAIRQEYHLDPARRRLVFSGRLVSEKRVDLLIEAFARIATERPEWDVVIAGDGPLRADLEGRVPPLLRQRVRFIGFVGDQAKLSAVYKACHALVLPSDYEPWALVVNEAAAAGLAVVASDVVGAAHELVDYETAPLFPPGDLDALTAAVSAATAPPAAWTTHAGEVQTCLTRWRATADPVVGLAAALAAVGAHDRGRHVRPPGAG